MPRSRPQPFWHSLRRRLFAAVALLAYGLAAGGIPLPGRAAPGHCGCCGCEKHAGQTADRDAAPSPFNGQPASPISTESPEKTCGCCTGGAKSCCSSHSPKAPEDVPPDPAAPDRRAPAVNAAKCHCATVQWVTTGEVSPPPALLTWVPFLAPDGRVSSADADAPPVPLVPPDPPPRPPSV
jgi:hypothetical protein